MIKHSISYFNSKNKAKKHKISKLVQHHNLSLMAKNALIVVKNILIFQHQTVWTALILLPIVKSLIDVYKLNIILMLQIRIGLQQTLNK